MGLFSRKPVKPEPPRAANKPVSPTECLVEILKLADRIERMCGEQPKLTPIDETALAMIYRVRALNMWIYQGGELPQVWKSENEDG